MDYEDLELLGTPFRIVDTYVYYDGPKAFALRSIPMPDLYYIVNTVDEEENGDVIALAAAVNGDRFRAIRSGLLTFRAAFEGAGRHTLSKITWRWSVGVGRAISSVSAIDPDALNDSWLPVGDLRLNIPTDTAKSFDLQELVSLSEADHRTVFALEVEPAGSTRTELPLRIAGELQQHMGSIIEGTIKSIASKTKSKIAREITPLTLGTRAASYVFLMAIDSASMLEPIELTSVALERWNAVVRAIGTADTERLLELLRELPSPVRNNLRRLLQALKSMDSGVSASSVVAFSRSVIRYEADASKVRTAVAAIDGAKPKIKRINVERGLLTGFVLDTRAFVLVNMADGARYKGHMDPEAAAQANGFPVGDASFVSGVVRVEIAFAAEEEATGKTYFMESIEQIDR